MVGARWDVSVLKTHPAVIAEQLRLTTFWTSAIAIATPRKLASPTHTPHRAVRFALIRWGLGGRGLSNPNRRLARSGDVRAELVVCLCRLFRWFGLGLGLSTQIRQARTRLHRERRDESSFEWSTQGYSVRGGEGEAFECPGPRIRK